MKVHYNVYGVIGGMVLTINLYVNKKYQEVIDQITVVAQGNGKPVSVEICKAVRSYMNTLNDKTELVADNEDWVKFLNNSNKEELYEMSRLLCDINDRIVRKVMSK